MGEDFRKEENRAHAQKKSKSASPLGGFVERSHGGLLHAFKTQVGGEITGLSVDIGSLVGEGSLVGKLSHPSRNTEESQSIIAKAGANNFGSFPIEKNARLEVFFEPTEGTAATVTQVFVSYSLVH